MEFRIGPALYKVKISRDPLYADGQEAVGLCLWEEGLIWLSPVLPPRQRTRVLYHELRHAWEYEMGRARDTMEDRATSAAAFNVDIMRQLQAQGGEPALWRLTPEGVIDHTRGELLPAVPVGAECALCGGRFTIQQIVTEPAIANPTNGGLMVKRMLYCDHCSALQEWLEAATQAGHPTGQVLVAPRHWRDRETVAAFLSKHAREAGVLAA